jgi:hypothetical protein
VGALDAPGEPLVYGAALAADGDQAAAVGDGVLDVEQGQRRPGLKPRLAVG